MKTLYKTTITIYTDYDPTDQVELEDLASEATGGGAICDVMKSEPVVFKNAPEGVRSFFTN